MELASKINRLQSDKQSLQDALAHLKHTLSNLDTAKQEAERAAVRSEKDKNAVLKTLEKV
jgi:prefoldin subunit 5